MTTLRKELKKAGFDFSHGRILYQEAFCIIPSSAGKNEVGKVVEIDLDSPILDIEKDYNCFSMPRFVAEDRNKIYLPCECNGVGWVEWVYKDINKYIEYGLTPYLGCG